MAVLVVSGAASMCPHQIFIIVLWALTALLESWPTKISELILYKQDARTWRPFPIHTPEHHLHIIHPAAAIAWKTGPRLKTDKVLWLHFPGLDPACRLTWRQWYRLVAPAPAGFCSRSTFAVIWKLRVTPSVNNQLLENLELVRVRFVALSSPSATENPSFTWPLRAQIRVDS